MECLYCQTQNPSRFRFCGACGQRLGVTICGACGFATPLPFTFCGDCGTPLDIRAETAEERKLATVLFADVVGFTSMADGSDPEDTTRAVDAALRQVTEIVLAHGGTIDKYMGDSLMAVFGVPVAHDDDAERAVAAALAIMSTDTGLGFAIGVNTGEVMITALAGGAVTVMGDTVNVAARLEKAANHNEVLVGPVTYELTAERVNYRDRLPMTLKGKREQVEVRQAVSLRGLAPDTTRVPLFGRREELDFLLAQWKRMRATGRGTLVLLTGEAGIGKSRLLDEFAAELGDAAFIVRTAYPPYGGYGGVRVSGDLVSQLGPSDDATVQAKVRSLAGDVDQPLREMGAATLRTEQLWALRRLIDDRTKRSPVLLIIEDVHMATTSIELLAALVSRIADLPVMLVFAGRNEGRWLTSFPTANVLRVGPLSSDDAAALAKHLGAGNDEELILRSAGGNPLFLHELIAYARTAGPDDHGRRQLPLSLRAVLAARLDAFTPAERVALQDFAVIGDTATVEQLVALGGPTASEGLAGLTNAGVLRHRPDGSLRITEPLLREVAYATMARTTRVERHLRMAELSSTLDDKARHIARAHRMAPDDEALRERAAAALAEAGRAAFDASRRADGIRMLTQAVDAGLRDHDSLLRLADALRDTDAPRALQILDLIPTATSDPHLDAERVFVHAKTLTSVDPDGAGAGFNDAIERWQHLGDSEKEAWTHTDKGRALFGRGAMEHADAELGIALELFRAKGNRRGELAVLATRTLVRPDHPDVEVWLQDALGAAVALGDRGQRLSVMGSLQWHHVRASRLGDVPDTEQARAWIDEAAVVSEELAARNFESETRALRASLARMRGDFEAATADISAVQELRGSGATPDITTDRGDAQRLAAAVEASLVPGTTFQWFEPTDPLGALAAAIQMETAMLEGRFAELINAGCLPQTGTLLDTHYPDWVAIAAVGLAQIWHHDRASELALLALADSAITASARLLARAALAECTRAAGREPESLADEAAVALAVAGDEVGHRNALPSPVGIQAAAASRGRQSVQIGLAHAVVLRAEALGGSADALDALRAWCRMVRAPGLLQGFDTTSAAGPRSTLSYAGIPWIPRSSGQPDTH